ALLLNDFTMLKTVPGEDYKVSLEPAAEVAQCIDGVLVLFDLVEETLAILYTNGVAQQFTQQVNIFAQARINIGHLPVLQRTWGSW
ncbi:hypothetical protein HUT00_37945, partial [Pseudomonas chlororaphis]|nr:hypothetical protein [Pseudomonas chlororaphis]